MTFDSQMTVIKHNLDPYGKYYGPSQSNGFSLHPTPEPTASPLATSSIRPGPRERTNFLHEQGNIPRRVPTSGPGWMSPNRRSRSQISAVLRARPSSLPLMSSRSLSQQPQHQHRVETSSSQSIFSLPGMQQLQNRLLQLAEQQRQQQQLATPPIRPRQAFSESEIFLPPLPRQTEMIGTEDHYEGDHMTSTAPLIQESHNLISGKQSLQIERGMNLDSPFFTDVHTEVRENMNTSEANLQMEQELEEVRRAIEEASDRYNEAVQKLRHAKEREQALMFEQDRRMYSGGADYEPGSDEESLTEHPSLYSKDSSRDPSAYEQFPLFPPTDLPYQYQHIQQRQQLQNYSQQRLRPLASPVLGREFIQPHENRASPLQARKLDLQMGERQRSVTVVLQSGDAVSGREPSLPREQRTAQPSACQENSNASGSSSSGNSGSDRNNNIGGDAHEKAKELLQQYLSSPRIKIKSEESESKPSIHGSAASSKKEPEDDPGESRQRDWYKEYKEYSIPIEIPSSETDASSEADRMGASTSQTGGAEATFRGKHSVRWRPPTPVPAKVNSQYKKERHPPVLPTIGATSEYNGTDISRRPYRRAHLSGPRSGRSYIPLPRPYPPQTSSRVTSTSPLPQAPSQIPSSRTTPQRRHRHGGQRSQTRPRIRVASSSTGSLGPRFSEFLNAINAEPELQQQVTGSQGHRMIVFYTNIERVKTNIERVEHYHHYYSKKPPCAHTSSCASQQDASLDMEEDIEAESESMEEDEGSEREVESEVGDEQMEDCSE
ncbi:hypothetical protein BGZ80_011236 [Entomortierella chlamydospora]|uniref:Uncharacterized protein n=1 Tax=Entomortierella chlamydospora TaxID=101097 RepID=A0A9P6N305_9FUNG|nr:hypothetical protein BGZ79_003485 [Entomortierella chlamydospora]KAG0022756.1 hypothetical protein BGZ80_011236 [Entomortierella chlamydospora]